MKKMEEKNEKINEKKMKKKKKKIKKKRKKKKEKKNEKRKIPPGWSPPTDIGENLRAATKLSPGVVYGPVSQIPNYDR